MACRGGGRGGNGVSPLFLIVISREKRSMSVFPRKKSMVAAKKRKFKRRHGIHHDTHHAATSP
jgi:hypothetical protein